MKTDDDLEGTRASLADALNTALRENYGGAYQVEVDDDFRPAIQRLAEGVRHGVMFCEVRPLLASRRLDREAMEKAKEALKHAIAFGGAESKVICNRALALLETRMDGRKET